jgi:hypothetical protein
MTKSSERNPKIAKRIIHNKVTKDQKMSDQVNVTPSS